MSSPAAERHDGKRVRHRALDWMRGAPARSGAEVVDREGAPVGRLVAVALGADGEIESYDVSVIRISSGHGVKRLAGDEVIVGHDCLTSTLHRRQILDRPNAPVRGR